MMDYPGGEDRSLCEICHVEFPDAELKADPGATNVRLCKWCFEGIHPEQPTPEELEEDRLREKYEKVRGDR